MAKMVGGFKELCDHRNQERDYLKEKGAITYPVLLQQRGRQRNMCQLGNTLIASEGSSEELRGH